MTLLQPSDESNHDNASRTAIFGAYAVALRRAGLAVLPAKGKRPVRSNFHTMRYAPSLATVEQWAETNAEDNIVYVPGLSRTQRNPNGVVVVDADNSIEVERAEKIFGSTPAMIGTRRGRHFLYRAPDHSLGKLGSLRKVGFDIDIKHGQSGSGISVAPPSRHPDQHDFAYVWHQGSGPETLADLPPFNVKALQELITGGSKTLPHATGRGSEMLPNVTGTAPRPRVGAGDESKLHCESRGLGLNKFLAYQGGYCDTLDEIIDVARTWNDNLANSGMQPIDDGEVVTTAVWDDYQTGKLVRTHVRRAIAITDADEVRELLAEYENGAEAVALLMLLRAEHSARCLRGETFALNLEAMRDEQVMGSWAVQRYRKARDTLLRTGLIKLVSYSGYRQAAQYQLGERHPTPSVAKRETLESR